MDRRKYSSETSALSRLSVQSLYITVGHYRVRQWLVSLTWVRATLSLAVSLTALP